MNREATEALKLMTATDPNGVRSLVALSKIGDRSYLCAKDYRSYASLLYPTRRAEVLRDEGLITPWDPSSDGNRDRNTLVYDWYELTDDALQARRLLTETPVEDREEVAAE